MANRTLRRTPINGQQNRIVIDGDAVIDGVTVRVEPDGTLVSAGTEPAIDGTSTDDANEPNEPVRNGVVEIDPAALSDFIASGGNSGDGNDTRRRRRADAGTKRGKRGRKQETPSSIEPLLNMVHTWASVLLKIPELQIEPDEAKKLSDSYCKFCEYHEVPILTPKRQSEIDMIVSLCVVYGPRLIVISKRKKAKLKIVPKPEHSAVN